MDLLSKARKNIILDEKLMLLCRNKLLIIVELGFSLEGKDDWVPLFHTLIAKRHEKLSTIITTNRPNKDWSHYLGAMYNAPKRQLIALYNMLLSQI